MEITLRKADRLARQLKALIDDRTATASIKLSVFANYTDEDLFAARDEVAKGVREASANIEDMVNAVYDIREKLGVANVEHGIHVLLTERSKLEALGRARPGLGQVGEVPASGSFNTDAIKGKLAAMKVRATSNVDRYGARALDEIEVHVTFDPQTVYKKRLVAITDRIDYLNAMNNITVTPATEKTLHLFDLV